VTSGRVSECLLSAVISIDRRNTLSYREKWSDVDAEEEKKAGFYGGPKYGAMGALEAR
tara:strand:+ start:76 stop:249 length:174 start_codon:yes stop_codon:yes gene_type:complete